MHILDTQAPGLGKKLQALSPDERRRVVSRACIMASATIDSLEPGLAKLLDAIKRENHLSPSDLVDAAVLAEAVDERYFTSREQGATRSIWYSWFCQARLLTAMSVGFGETSWKETADSLYEICCSQSEPSHIIAGIKSDISSMPVK